LFTPFKGLEKTLLQGIDTLSATAVECSFTDFLEYWTYYQTFDLDGITDLSEIFLGETVPSLSVT
jgi:hypothetical protein